MEESQTPKIKIPFTLIIAGTDLPRLSDPEQERARANAHIAMMTPDLVVTRVKYADTAEEQVCECSLEGTARLRGHMCYLRELAESKLRLTVVCDTNAIEVIGEETHPSLVDFADLLAPSVIHKLDEKEEEQGGEEQKDHTK